MLCEIPSGNRRYFENIRWSMRPESSDISYLNLLNKTPNQAFGNPIRQIKEYLVRRGILVNL